MKKSYLTILVLCGIAWLNALYLSYQAYTYQFLPVSERPISFCDINATFSCTNVLAHPGSLVFGIPFPMIAAVVYPILAIIAIIGIMKPEKIAPMFIISILSSLGMLFNFYIISIEYSEIHSYCYLCLICTAIIIAINFISSLSL